MEKKVKVEGGVTKERSASRWLPLCKKPDFNLICKEQL